jgi:hypothetical protein
MEKLKRRNASCELWRQLLRRWALLAQSQSVLRLQQRLGTATILATTAITVADGVAGMAALRGGPSKAAFVSRIVMVRGIGMGTLGGTGTAN